MTAYETAKARYEKENYRYSGPWTTMWEELPIAERARLVALETEKQVAISHLVEQLPKFDMDTLFQIEQIVQAEIAKRRGDGDDDN